MSSNLLVHLDHVRRLPEITLGALAAVMKQEGIVVVCLVSILPFMQPIPIPGLSSILGFVALLQGISLMFLQAPLLTRRMKSVAISPERFEQIYRVAEKFCRIANKIAVARHPWTNSKASRFICGLSIIISAAFLSLPLPIPFSNFVPALSIALVCLGLLEEDIILVIVGLSITVAVIWMGVFSYHLIVEQLPRIFS